MSVKRPDVRESPWRSGRHWIRRELARAYLQNLGRLDVQFVVPLDAPRFDMTFRGTPGAMPAAGLNGFVRETMPRASVRDGLLAPVSWRPSRADG